MRIYMSKKILIFIIAIILTFILLFCNSCNSSVEEPENLSPIENMDKINLMREDFDLGNCKQLSGKVIVVLLYNCKRF